MSDSSFDSVPLISSGSAFQALGLAHRVRVPSGPGLRPTLIMLHGLQGNEDVTWVFARSADPDWLILVPRAPLSDAGGYSWYPVPADQPPSAESFYAGLSALEHFIDGAQTAYPVDPTRRVLLGFSQGSTMAYAYAFRHRERVAGVAALSGLVARLNQITIPPLAGLPVLILHGTQDTIIPVSMAQRTRDRLTEAGAHVTYEESAIGHKTSAHGLRTLSAWLRDRKQATAP
jgi:phospholipase/carboxylesterase